VTKRLLPLLFCLILAAPSFAATPLPPGASFDAAFSPRGGGLELVLSTIKAAQKTIRVAAYSFTSKPIATALVDAHRRGVDVRVVADKNGNFSRYTATTFLANQGVPVRLNGSYAIHHHKFMVIDGQTLQTGSFNYSKAAEEKNAENVLVVHSAPELAGKYAAEWERLWSEGQDVGKRY
jgi:phosphatidylserine/phosphatidylglycerophosphate/cardiolipin synthase-like enzyme